MSQSIGRPTWAEIDLDALAHNFRVIRARVGDGVKILAAVKANAYGHGAVECARRLQQEGADWFGVALAEEGFELRQAGIAVPILCLGGFWRGEEIECIHQNLTPVIFSTGMLEPISVAAAGAGSTVDVHVKIDTGMGRLGVRHDALAEFCDALARFKNIRVDGVMTHLAAADDEAQKDFTRLQLERFAQAVEVFRARGVSPNYIHAANSAGTFSSPESWGNLVRPGGTLYGFSRDVLPANIEAPLLPVMSLRTRVMLVKDVPAGEHLGYGCTFQTKRDSVIATLPIGYDDGYRRAFSNCGRVIIRGQFAPVVGRVSMDLTLIDVTDVGKVQVDDEVTMLGRDGECSITGEDLGELAGTISYEITCGISNRVPRIYRSTMS